MITKAVVDAAHEAFESESRKWLVRQMGGNWVMDKSAETFDLSAAGAAVEADENIEVFNTRDKAELAKRDKIIAAVLVAVDCAYMGVKPDA